MACLTTKQKTNPVPVSGYIKWIICANVLNGFVLTAFCSRIWALIKIKLVLDCLLFTEYHGVGMGGEGGGLGRREETNVGSVRARHMRI